MNAIEVVSIPVSNQQVSKEFYLKLGFQVLNETPMGNGDTWVQLHIPGQRTTISLVTWFKNIAPGSSQGLVLHVDDIEKEVADLKAKGIAVNNIDPTPWGKFADFKDPDGNGMIFREELKQ